MPSKDLLERLFDVEREAEATVAEAREEAGRRLDAARTRARSGYAEVYDAALARAQASRQMSEKAAREEYESALQTYRKKLEESPLDHESFTAACLAALEEAR